MSDASPPTSSGLNHYQWMAMSRALEEALSDLNTRWFPARGEEAAIVGSFVDLGPNDVCAPHYRGPFVVYLMRGAELWRLTAQAMGKTAGYNKGRSVPFTGPFELGVVPWVAGDLGSSLGVATGAALALKHSKRGGVCVCSFGDGTSNRGDFHENVNLAAAWQLPIIYVCQNNGWAISQSADGYLRAPVASRAAGYGIPGVSVDGQDIDAVRAVLAEAVSRARAGGGPTLVEALTDRVRGHWAGDEASYRLEIRDTRDPIELLGERLIAKGAATGEELQKTKDEVQVAVADAIERSTALPDPTEADLAPDDTYA